MMWTTMYGNFDIVIGFGVCVCVWGGSLICQLHATPHAPCDMLYRLRNAHACQMLIGAGNPMLCLIHVFRHWTRFVKPGWRAVPCTDVTALTGRCALPGGGNYAALTSPDTDDIAIIVHTFTHDSSKCVRNDPPDWEIDASQTVSFKLAGVKPADVHVWRSCTGWVYPGDTDGWFERQPDAAVTADGTLTVQIARDCYYTFTTVGGVTKPPVPAGVPGSVAFPLPYADDFDGVQVGAEPHSLTPTPTPTHPSTHPHFLTKMHSLNRPLSACRLVPSPIHSPPPPPPPTHPPTPTLSLSHTHSHSLAL